MQTIEITGATGGSGTYDIYLCDITLANCFLISGSTTIPPNVNITLPLTFSNPSPPPATIIFNETSSLIVKLIDVNTGCEKFIPYYCPSATPTQTPTPTPTPTLETCICNQISNSSSSTTYNFTYKDCVGNTLVNSIPPLTNVYVCGTVISLDVNLINTITGPCVDGTCPSIFLTPTPTPTITPTTTPAPIMCFSFQNELMAQTYKCNISSVFYFNGKPVYPIFFSDCSTFTGTFVFWDTTFNYWIHSDGVNTFSFNANPSQYPESNGTYPWIANTPPGIQFRIQSSSIGLCPTPTPTPTPTLPYVMREMISCCSYPNEYALIPPSINIGDVVKLDDGTCWTVDNVSVSAATLNFVSLFVGDCTSCNAFNPC